MNFLFKWRQKQRFTYDEVAERIHVSAEEFERAERGGVVKPETRKLLEARFKRPLDKLQSESEIRKPMTVKKLLRAPRSERLGNFGVP